MRALPPTLIFVKARHPANFPWGSAVLSVVKRRAYIVGALVIGLMATASRTAPAYCRVVSSALKFQQSFRDLKQADTMSPIERFVFSLVLTQAKTPSADPGKPGIPVGRS
jgi:hypothetical protein